MTQRIEFSHGHFGRTKVEIDGEGISVGKNKQVRRLRFEEMTLVRMSNIPSKYQQSFTLRIEGIQEILEIDYNTTQTRPLAKEGFSEAREAILCAISKHRPDISATTAAPALTRFILFFCYGIPSLIVFMIGAVMLGEPDGGAAYISTILVGVFGLAVAMLSVFQPGQKTMPVGEMLQKIRTGDLPDADLTH